MQERSVVVHLKPVHTDERGEIWDVLEGQDVRHAGYILSRQGAVRGNHYHKKATQYTYILRGKVEWVTRDLRDPGAEPKSHILTKGDLAITPPEVAHVLIALEDTEFLDMTDVSRADGGYETDTVRIKVRQ